MSPRILALVLVLAPLLVACRVTRGPEGEPAPEPTLLGTRLTNDLGNLNNDYTHGTEVWVSQPVERAPAFVRGLADGWLVGLLTWPLDLGAGEVDRRVLRYRLAQQVYTPVNLRATALQVDDRPYAGWLHAGLSIARTRLDPDPDRRRDRRAALEIDLGIVGPSSLGEPIQESWHDFWELQPVNGWDNQLHDEPALLVVRRHDWRVHHAALGEDADLDALAFADWSVGNLRTGLELGATLRLGRDLPRDFGMRSPARPGPDGGGAHLLLDLSGRYVAQDLFLDGNTWKDSHAVDKEPFVGQVGVGFSLPLGDGLRLRLMRALRSEEFEGQVGSRGVWTLDLATSL